MTGVSSTYLAGSIFNILRRTQHGDAQSQQQQTCNWSPVSPAPAAVAAAAESESETPGLLTVASPNKTWVGVTGAIVLGTATALALEGLACRLFTGTLSRTSVGLPEQAEDIFSITAMDRGLLCATGVAICVVGVVGDLWESLLKRTAMVKVSALLWCFWGSGVQSWIVWLLERERDCFCLRQRTWPGFF